MARLHQRGAGYVAQKVVEEAGETIVAALEERPEELRGEAADLLFHLTVLLRERGLSLADVGATLIERHRERVRALSEDEIDPGAATGRRHRARVEAWTILPRARRRPGRHGAGALVLDTVRVTEQAAIAASRVAGKGDEDLVDTAGTEAMRAVLSELDIDGRIVIGEGERDDAPMLFIGEKLGRGGEHAWPVDIAVDPVEGTGITARLVNGSVTVIALSERGGLLHAPDVYMEKLIVCPPAVGMVDLEWPVAANLQAVAASLGREVRDLTVAILDRPRHEQLVRDVRETGVRVKLIDDGDVIAALSASVRGTNMHAVSVLAAPPRASWRPRRCAVSAARSKAASSPATTTSVPGSSVPASRRAASTAPTSSRPASRSSSARRGSPTATCCAG